MGEDISKQTVLVLVAISLVVSMFSTLMVLNTVYSHSPEAPEPEYKDPLGVVRFHVTAPELETEVVGMASVTVKEVSK